jgi:hypothetical protein
MKILKVTAKMKILFKSIALFTAMAIPAILFIACGGGGGGGGIGASSGSENSSGNSITDCYNCHADGVIAKYASENIFSTWRGGPHGNYEGGSYKGDPAYTDLDASCLTCHDERGDGELLQAYYQSTGISFLGTENRPLVGCESCHGSGDTHFGVGPIPYPNPDASICGNCHDDDNHVDPDDNPEVGNIYTNYQTSPHAGSIESQTYAAGSTTDVQPLCSKCHTDEGARKYTGYTAEYSSQDARFAGESDVADANAVKCNTCHNAHDPSQLLMAATSGKSAEYNTCTNCHQDTADNYHGENNPDSWSGGAVDSGTLDTSHTIYDSHFDDSSTTDIEGYNIDKAGSRSCRGCHNQHNADTTINVEWANSSHGGFILETTQDAATHKYEVTEAEGPAWVHYDFKGSSRQACQRCHTATGFKNLADSPSTYNPANNNFSYLTSNQKEMLYCWACHKSNVGDLRNPGQFVLPSSTTYVYPSGRSFPTNLAGSFICVNCHSGRVTGQYVANYSGSISVSFSSFNSHYLAEGGILFRTIGYEFTGLDYSNGVTFAHDTIGTTGGTDGDGGPCVGCHMMTDDDHPNHELEPVEKDGSDQVTDIKVYNNVCSKCHGNKATLISTLNTRDTQYNAALDAIETQLESKGICFSTSNPYFFVYNAGACTATTYTSWPDKDTLGAAYNLNLFKHAPKAYAHNREYVRKLIYDSIDFLDDGTMNQSVEATLGGSGDAYDYLNGTR